MDIVLIFFANAFYFDCGSDGFAVRPSSWKVVRTCQNFFHWVLHKTNQFMFFLSQKSEMLQSLIFNEYWKSVFFTQVIMSIIDAVSKTLDVLALTRAAESFGRFLLTTCSPEKLFERSLLAQKSKCWKIDCTPKIFKSCSNYPAQFTKT